MKMEMFINVQVSSILKKKILIGKTVGFEHTTQTVHFTTLTTSPPSISWIDGRINPNAKKETNQFRNSA